MLSNQQLFCQEFCEQEFFWTILWYIFIITWQIFCIKRYLNAALKYASINFEFLEESLFINSNEVFSFYRKQDGTGYLKKGKMIQFVFVNFFSKFNMETFAYLMLVIRCNLYTFEIKTATPSKCWFFFNPKSKQI